MGKRIQFYLSDSFYSLLLKYAEKKGLKPHELARRIVVDTLLEYEFQEILERKKRSEAEQEMEAIA